MEVQRHIFGKEVLAAYLGSYLDETFYHYVVVLEGCTMDRRFAQAVLGVNVGTPLPEEEGWNKGKETWKIERGG